MRIYKRPKFEKITCAMCDCVFRPESKDIKWHRYEGKLEDDLYVNCPGCGHHIIPKFNFKYRTSHSMEYWEKNDKPARRGDRRRFKVIGNSEK